MINQVLQGMGFQTIVYSFDEALETILQSYNLAGKLAYIVYADSPRVLKVREKVLVVYTTHDPYSWKKRSNELTEKFTLVDLSQWLKCSPSVDPELQKTPPWEVLQQLANPRAPYRDRLGSIERDPMLTNVLYNNLGNISPDITAISRICERLSGLDRSFYIDKSGEHTNLLESMAIIRGAGLSGQERTLRWQRQGIHNQYKKKSKSDRTIFNAYAGKSGLKYPSSAMASLPIRQVDTPKNPSGPRKAPQCKRCNVPLKGHKGQCPFRVNKN